MVAKLAISVLIVFAMLVGWVMVQHISRRFAARHPEFGPAREEGAGCGGLLCQSKDGKPCPFRSAGFCHEEKAKAANHELSRKSSTT